MTEQALGSPRKKRKYTPKQEEQWNDMLERLKAHKSQHGDCRVPRGYKSKSDDQLALWVKKQRLFNTNNKLQEDQKAKLESIGFVWTVNPDWNEMFTKLKEYKRQHGDCRVPRGYKNDPSLAVWVQTQRRALIRENRILPERKAKLESIGFVWTVNPDWNEMFTKLKEYKRQHGDCRVPTGYNNDPALARWVGKQRSFYTNNKLQENRKAKLESIGFTWVAGPSAKGPPWDAMFDKLKEYKRQHGNCCVPWGYKSDRQLARWVTTQRKALRENRILPERKAKLESIGFVWDVSRADWDRMFERLKEYKSLHGNCPCSGEGIQG